MLTEDYCDFETAKLLKEKGFDESISTAYLCCDGKYWDKRFKEMSCDICQNEWYDAEDTVEFGHLLLAPTLQMAMKWLREVHKIIITIDYNDDGDCEENERWGYSVFNPYRKVDHATYVTYEETAEAAIKYCLENLIK